VLLTDVATVSKALEFNQEIFQGKHLRVDMAFGQRTDGKVKNDFDTTIFIGNIPFIASEEEIREHFADIGQITNVRLVRDPKTFVGKGIGYVMFTDKESMRKAIDTKNGSKFKGREMRIKKASPPERLDKKKRMKEQRAEAHAVIHGKPVKEEGDAAMEESEDEVAQIPRGAAFGDLMESEDSEDEKPKKKKEVKKDPDFNSFGKSSENIKTDFQMDNVIALNKRKR